MIKPTVGRVVWVHRPHFANDPSQPEAALITFVHSDTLINVGGFDQNGLPFSASLDLIQEGSIPPREGTNWAEWMPHQKAQASISAKPPFYPEGSVISSSR